MTGGAWPGDPSGSRPPAAGPPDFPRTRRLDHVHAIAGRAGFTLIELLIVVVIIGILASIAIPKFGAVREKAFRAAMMSDLHNLANAQDMYHNT